MRRRQRPTDEAEINITPMLDIVFIMLIFFIVTTSFVREAGLDITRPAQTDEPEQVDLENLPIVVEINQHSLITIDNRLVDPQAVRPNLESRRAVSPNSPLIVAAHVDSDTNTLVAVLDAANVARIDNISVATTGGQ